ncbi:MAG TPA: hypothetical protein VIU61_30765 [Kofleriaceae bacterium]
MNARTLGNVARVAAVTAACIAAVGSASSNQNQNQQSAIAPQGQSSAPPPRDMEPGRALGLWRSSFGAVKIEADDANGGLERGAVQGVWVYQRNNQEVVGYFNGNLRGNVLQFRWQEPNNPPLTGEGYLVFDPQGRQYSGRWWTDRRDRVGDWNGRRSGASEGGDGGAYDGGAYGGNTYGGATDRDPYRDPQPQPEQEPYGTDPYRQPSRQPARRPAPPPSSPRPTYY